MTGWIAGAFFTPFAQRARVAAAEDRLPRPAEGRWHRQRFFDRDIALFVGGRTPGAGLATTFAQITETERAVVAVEGYIVNLDELTDVGANAPGSLRGDRLIAVLERHGPEVLARLDGGFTLMHWHKASRAATITTCKGGRRSLYSFPAAGGTMVASDLSALGRLAERGFALDADAIGPAAMYGGVPGQRTLLKGVTRVLPGSVVTVEERTCATAPAVHLAQPGGSGVRRRAADYIDELDALMRRSVRRLARVGDTQAVMVGSGVDSSLVAAYARTEVPRLTAVTQRMPAELDESAAAARLVKALGLPHTVIPYEPRQGLVADAATFVRTVEEPAYWNQLGPALLQLLTRLVEPPDAFLTGAEGDLLFNFRLPGRISPRQVIADGYFWPVAIHTTRRLVNRVTRHTYVTGSDFDLLDRDFLRQHLAGDCLREGGPPGHYRTVTTGGALGELAQHHFIDNGWQNVRIICQLACAGGSEALFPYLDHDVAVAVLSLPNELKINKVLLRTLLARFLPREMVPAAKRGYWAHTIKWHYERHVLQDVLAVLTDRQTLERGLYEAVAVRALVDTYLNGTASSRSHPVLWQLLLLELFCREFVDGPRS